MMQQNIGVQRDSLEQYCLSQANPIQKPQKLKPLSIFPLHILPKFNYKSETIQPTFSPESQTTPPEKLILPSTSLKQLFNEPVYVYNQRALMKSNRDFGCLGVQYSESSIYRMKYNAETIEQYQLANQTKSNSKNPTSKPLSPFSLGQQILFQSRFQSGNLCFAAASANEQQTQYYLILSRDMNTSKCTQWFFFKTINTVPGKVTFHILNFIKKYSAFQAGMKVCFAAKSQGYMWQRGGSDIKYRETNIPILSKKSDRCYYSLSFSYTYTHPQDNVYFAYCYPYTYSMLQQLLFHSTETSPYIKRRNIATTPGGNSVDMITITNFKQREKKKTVFFIARVHPGETPSSFVCEGIIKYLIGDSLEAVALRQHFVFKIVPMINPDGVINGSYRCSLSGYDLNRVWHRADRTSHPEIYAVRKAIFETNQVQKIFMFADLHAHSKKKGIFAYGCQNRANPYACRQIPYLFWRNVHDFNYYQCNFMMRTGRQGTSRLYIYQQLDIDYCYTIEHSFCGPAKDRTHYHPRLYINIGIEYLLTLSKFFCRNRSFFNGGTDGDIFYQLYRNKELVKVGEAEDDSSSDDDELDKQKAPSGAIKHKSQKKPLIKNESIRTSEGAITNSKRPKNIRKKSGQSIDTRPKQIFSTKPAKQAFEFNETIRPLPVVVPSLRKNYSGREQQIIAYIQNRPRICSSSLTNHMGQEQKKNTNPLKQAFRYQQDQDIANLTNLFLPSLTKASYKKYSRKSSSPKNMVYAGTSMLQNAMMMKQDIKASKKKKPNWKQQARSYL